MSMNGVTTSPSSRLRLWLRPPESAAAAYSDQMRNPMSWALPRPERLRRTTVNQTRAPLVCTPKRGEAVRDRPSAHAFTPAVVP